MEYAATLVAARKNNARDSSSRPWSHDRLGDRSAA
jgi:hypothetical protein